MKNDDFVLKLLKLLASEKTGENNFEKCDLTGHGVIIRCRDAGVHYGKLVGYSGRKVELKNARRMWEWWSASENTLSGVARHGINKFKSKIQGPLESIILLEACEIIPISGDAERSLINAEIYNEQ